MDSRRDENPPTVSLGDGVVPDSQAVTWPGGSAETTVVTADGRRVWVVRPRFARTSDGAELADAFESWSAVSEHEHTATLLDWVGEGEPRFAVPAPEGGTLRQGLDDDSRTFWIDEAIEIARDLSAAVANGHANGQQHHAIAPQSIYLRASSSRRYPVLADWGIGATLGRDPDAIRGVSVRYAAPEQLRESGTADERTDCYRLAAVTYELITGRPPFDGDGMAVTNRVLTERPTPPSERCRTLSPVVDDPILRGLSTDPEKRYQSATAFAAALQAIDVPDAVTTGGVVSAETTPSGSADPRADAAVGRLERDMEVSWQHRANGAVSGSPVVGHDTVYAGSLDGTLRALHPRNGAVRWTADMDDPVAATPAVTSGTVVASSGDAVSAFDAETGVKRWTRSLGVDHTPAIVEETVYVAAAADGMAYGLDLATGETRWKGGISSGTQPRHAGSMAMISTGPTVTTDSPSSDTAGGTLTIGTVNGGVISLDASDGTERWRFGTDGRIVGAPATRDGVVFFTDTSETLYAACLDTGEYHWEYDLTNPPRGSPAVADGTVYVATGAPSGHDAGAVVAVDAQMGGEQWSTYVDETVTGGPTVAGTAVFVGTQSGVHGVVRGPGTDSWRLDLGGSVQSPMVVARATDDGHAVGYVGSQNNLVSAMEPGDR